MQIKIFNIEFTLKFEQKNVELVTLLKILTQWKSKYVVLQPNYFFKNGNFNILDEI